MRAKWSDPGDRARCFALDRFLLLCSETVICDSVDENHVSREPKMSEFGRPPKMSEFGRPGEFGGESVLDIEALEHREELSESSLAVAIVLTSDQDSRKDILAICLERLCNPTFSI